MARAVELLREVGVTSALLHGGTSTVYGLGKPLDAEYWKVAIEGAPENAWSYAPTQPIASGPTQGRTPNHVATVRLQDEALSVSAVWGKSFQRRTAKTFGHVLDPRTGQPVRGALLAAVALPSATETDAFSTALLTLGAAGHELIANLRPGMRTLLVVESESGKPIRAESRGISVRSPG